MIEQAALIVNKQKVLMTETGEAMLKIQAIKHKIGLLGVSLALLIGGCSSIAPVKVNYDQNIEVNTSEYKTFAWLTKNKIMSMPEALNPVMKVRVDRAIEGALIKRGYQLIDDKEKSDFTVSYSLGSRDKIDISSYPAMYQSPMRRGFRGGFYGGMATETHVRQYKEGSLAIDIFDVKSHEPVWHGWATQKIYSKATKELNEINLIVEQVISQFK